jgi:hypothetical protein
MHECRIETIEDLVRPHGTRRSKLDPPSAPAAAVKNNLVMGISERLLLDNVDRAARVFGPIEHGAL